MDALDFLLAQFTGAFAHQDSIIVVVRHCLFSFSFWVGVARIAGLTFARVAVKDARTSECADGICAAPAPADAFDFLGGPGSRTCPSQHSCFLLRQPFS